MGSLDANDPTNEANLARTIIPSADQLANTAGDAATVFGSGTAITSTDFADKFQGYPVTKDGWYSYACSGYRNSVDNGSGLSKYTVHDVITFSAGFNVFSGAGASPKSAGTAALGTLLTYTVRDLAVMLTVSAAAISSVTTNMF